ncbi:hypothetical protein OESDEN_18749 [Oesophagostomum dentatum]|uniref:Malate dehydrogenase, cytoplasmic n=1 Tax=Oesophagostomum dentatum TaxID=61180 RepID=A0A0B1S9G3_OESDE|nr:hypothetical protein OESDEN_18749 [Oesophagostomum dentatum]
MSPLRVLVTGAAGQIGYSLVLQIAKGDVFGKDTPIVLVMLDIPPMATVLEGVQFELMDCALPNLHGMRSILRIRCIAAAMLQWWSIACTCTRRRMRLYRLGLDENRCDLRLRKPI